MSSNLPTDPADVIDFLSPRVQTWALNQPLIGSSPAQVAAVEAAFAVAKAAASKAIQAREASLAATLLYHTHVKALRDAARVVVENAKNLALETGDVNVYAKASLNPPKKRARQAPLPGKPQGLVVTVNSTGSLTIAWRSDNPRGLHGVVYEIRRKVLEVTERNGRRVVKWGGEQLLGVAGGNRRFVDETVPIGVPSVQYTVTPLHNGRRGTTSNAVSLQFGAAMPVASGTTAVPAKECQAVEPKMNGKPSLAA